MKQSIYINGDLERKLEWINEFIEVESEDKWLVDGDFNARVERQGGEVRWGGGRRTRERKKLERRRNK